MSVTARAERFVAQLCQALVDKVAPGAEALSSVTAVRAHLASVLRSLPLEPAAAAALRTHLLLPASLDAYAKQVAQALEKASRATAASSSATGSSVALFSARAYAAALSTIDRTLEEDPQTDLAPQYQSLLLPASAPSFVHQHLLAALTTQANSGSKSATGSRLLSAPSLALLALPFSASTSSASALLEQLEALLQIVRHFPVHTSALLPLSGLVDLVATRFAPLVSTLSAQQLRRYQNLVSLLLIEEAKRRSRDQWAAPGDVAKYVSRVRNALRKTGSTGFSGSLAGELMFLQHLLTALTAYKQGEKAYRATVAAKAASARTSSTKTKRSRSRSPSAGSSASQYHDVAVFHAPTFLGLWGALLSNIASILTTGARSEGAESEWIRFALVVRAVDSTGSSLSSSFQPLRVVTQQLAASIPSLPIPLTLRSAVAERVTGLTQCSQLWVASGSVSIKLAQLERILVEFEGDLTLRDRTGPAETTEEQEEEAAEEEDVAVPEPAKKKSKKATAAAAAAPVDNFDSFGAARDSSLFFLDSAGGASAAVGDDESGEGTNEEAEVGRSMSKILESITPAAALAKAAKKAASNTTKKAAAKKAQDEQEAAEAEAEEEEEEADADAMEIDHESADEEEEEAAEAEAEESEAEAEPESEPEVVAKPAKATRGKKGVSKEAPAAAAEPTTRASRRTKK